MTMNRVQFQAGLSIAEFMDRYGSDDKCEAALIESRWLAALPARRAAVATAARFGAKAGCTSSAPPAATNAASSVERSSRRPSWVCRAGSWPCTC